MFPNNCNKTPAGTNSLQVIDNYLKITPLPDVVDVVCQQRIAGNEKVTSYVSAQEQAMASWYAANLSIDFF